MAIRLEKKMMVGRIQKAKVFTGGEIRPTKVTDSPEASTIW